MPADEGILPWMALRVDLWRLATSKSRFRAGEAFASIPPNARHHLAARCDQRRRLLEVAAQVPGDVREWQECQAQEVLTPSQSPSP